MTLDPIGRAHIWHHLLHVLTDRHGGQGVINLTLRGQLLRLPTLMTSLALDARAIPGPLSQGLVNRCSVVNLVHLMLALFLPLNLLLQQFLLHLNLTQLLLQVLVSGGSRSVLELEGRLQRRFLGPSPGLAVMRSIKVQARLLLAGTLLFSCQ